jgi:hypothetical protein
MTSKILTLDIETKPALAYVWGLWDQNIGLSQLVTPSAPICFAAKFLDEKQTMFYSDWEDGHDAMILAARDLIASADAVVGYNSDGFDLKKLRGEFLLHGLTPPPPVTSIDLLKSVKKLGFQSNKLAFIGPMLNIGKKVKHEGFELWIKVMEGDEAAQQRMKKYCIGDVKLTEQLYKTLRPYISNHPHLGDTGKGACGACGGTSLQSRGWRRTKAFKIQRLMCTDCGSWQDGTRVKVG